MSNFPFLDLKRVYQANAPELKKAAERVFESGWFVLGEEVRRFESDFADYHQAEFAVGVGSGTDALVLALKATGLQSGDAVLTVSHTAVATVAAIRWAGLVPIFVDIDPQTFTMDPQSAAEAIDAYNEQYSIRAMIPVHLYGHPAPMPALLNLAQKHNIAVIEDCSQAHGASLNNKTVGNFGRFGCFSLYPTKNLGAFGDAGVLVCQTDSDNKRVRMLQQYGWETRYISELEGYNSRLDELQAALLGVRLKYLRQESERRMGIASRYTSALTKTPIQAPHVVQGALPVYHQYTVLSTERETILRHLTQRGIPTTTLYPQAVHVQAPYSDFPRVSLSQTEQVLSQLFQLPIYPQLRDAEVDQVISALKEL